MKRIIQHVGIGALLAVTFTVLSNAVAKRKPASDKPVTTTIDGLGPGHSIAI